MVDDSSTPIAATTEESCNMPELDVPTEMKVETESAALARGNETQASQNNNAIVASTTTSHSHASSSLSQPQEVDAEQEVIDLENDGGRKDMAARSEMWQHFMKMNDDKGVLRFVRCKYCHRNIKVETKSHGTSALKRHFNVCKRNPHRFVKDPTQGTLHATQGECIDTWRFDQDVLRSAFAEMVIEYELPFCFGEKSEFRRFMSKDCPRFQPPSKRTCTRDIVRCFFQEKAKLKKFFKDSCQRVCLTTDCWTSQQQDGYMTVTASFIDDNWNLHKKVIGFLW